MDITLSTPIRYIPRVGPIMAGRLERLDIRTVRDLLFHLPFRYEDFSHTCSIARLIIGTPAHVVATVESIKTVFTKTGKRFQQCRVYDESGTLTILWFNQPYLASLIHEGDRISLAGTLSFFGQTKAMIAPLWESWNPHGENTATSGIIPVYPATDGVTSRWIRDRIRSLLSLENSMPAEYLPEDLIHEYGLKTIQDALQTAHCPKQLNETHAARYRLAFDELLMLHLRSQIRKKEWSKQHRSHMFKKVVPSEEAFLSSLPFSLTDDQKQAIEAIGKDLSGSIPMNRLLLGDVGSGKTVVAAYAIYKTVLNGFSAVFLAPTQILATQHFETFTTLFTPFNIPVTLHTAATKKGKTDTKTPGVIVGTHAVFSHASDITRLGLLVIDEQQRFGVHQRSLLQEKREDATTPHVLTTTATPIPRTLALTVYGHLDVSLLSTMPTGRLPVKTWVVPSEKRDGAYEWIRKHIQETRSQAFIVCPFIDPSDTAQSVRSATKEYERLKTTVFPTLSITLIHGKMKAAQKDAILADFSAGKYDVCVATPVVEVGIDIPNATIMMIEGSERFGLSQLHQLRGRVGRRSQQSYCLLFTEGNEDAVSRLKILEQNHNGPDIAREDLKNRGQGNIFGIEQHGLPPFTFASLSDEQLVEKTRRAALDLLRAHPDLSPFPLLREMVFDRTIHSVSQN